MMGELARTVGPAIVLRAKCMAVRAVRRPGRAPAPPSRSQVAARLGQDGVIGVIPEDLAPREVSGELIGRVTVTKDMHSRKVGSWPSLCDKQGPLHAMNR